MTSTTSTNAKEPALPFDKTKRVYRDALEAIGNTPLIRLNRVTAELECDVWAKCEFFNAGGSVKDRIGRQMVDDAAASGRIKPGDTLIEPTSGNTGIGMSLAAAVRGYRMVITLPQKMSQEKVSVLQGLGAEVVRTPTEAAWDAPESHIGVAKRMQAELPNAHILDQYGNPSNPNAHYDGTAEEILAQTGGKLDMIVMSAGTGGTVTGVARKLKEKVPGVKVVGVDPLGSILAGPGPIHGYAVEGIGYDFIPDVLDVKLVDEWVRSDDVESFALARRLIHEEGLLCGGSSGSAMVGVLKAARQLKKGQVCVVLLPDSVRNYLTKFLDDAWLYAEGFKQVPVAATSLNASAAAATATVGTAADALALPAAPLLLPPATTCQEAADLLRKHGVAAAAVVHSAPDNIVRGLVTEASLLDFLMRPASSAAAPVTDAMVPTFKTVDASTSLQQLHFILKKNDFAVLVDRTPAGNVARNVVSRSSLLSLLSSKSKTA